MYLPALKSSLLILICCKSSGSDIISSVDFMDSYSSLEIVTHCAICSPNDFIPLDIYSNHPFLTLVSPGGSIIAILSAEAIDFISVLPSYSVTNFDNKNLIIIFKPSSKNHYILSPDNISGIQSGKTCLIK